MKKTESNIPYKIGYAKLRYDRLCTTCRQSIKKNTFVLRETSRITGFWINNTYCSKCDKAQIERSKDKDRLLIERRERGEKNID